MQKKKNKQTNKQTQITNKQTKNQTVKIQKTQKGIFLLPTKPPPSPHIPKEFINLYVLQVLLTCVLPVWRFHTNKMYHLPLHNNLWHHNNNRRILNSHLFWLNSHPFFAHPIICRLNLSVSAPHPPWCLDEKLLIKLWYIWKKLYNINF